MAFLVSAPASSAPLAPPSQITVPPISLSATGYGGGIETGLTATGYGGGVRAQLSATGYGHDVSVTLTATGYPKR